MGNDAKVHPNTTLKRFLRHSCSTSIPEHTGPGGAYWAQRVPTEIRRSRERRLVKTFERREQADPTSCSTPPRAGAPRQQPRTCSRSPSSANLFIIRDATRDFSGLVCPFCTCHTRLPNIAAFGVCGLAEDPASYSQADTEITGNAAAFPHSHVSPPFACLADSLDS